MSQKNQEQLHPLANKDWTIVSSLLDGEPTDYNLAELARLIIRYRGFPGAKEIKAGLEKLLNKWNLTEEELFEKTRNIHSKARVYRAKADAEDWI